MKIEEEDIKPKIKNLSGENDKLKKKMNDTIIHVNATQRRYPRRIFVKKINIGRMHEIDLEIKHLWKERSTSNVIGDLIKSCTDEVDDA
jgi:hypothetical protein